MSVSTTVGLISRATIPIEILAPTKARLSKSCILLSLVNTMTDDKSTNDIIPTANRNIFLRGGAVISSIKRTNAVATRTRLYIEEISANHINGELGISVLKAVSNTKLRKDIHMTNLLIDSLLLLTFNSQADCSQVYKNCLLYTSPSPRDRQKSRMP